MTFNESVKNLKTYEMNMSNFKKIETKEKSLALKASDSEDSNLDKENKWYSLPKTSKSISRKITREEQGNIKKLTTLLKTTFNGKLNGEKKELKSNKRSKTKLTPRNIMQ